MTDEKEYVQIKNSSHLRDVHSKGIITGSDSEYLAHQRKRDRQRVEKEQDDKRMEDMEHRLNNIESLLQTLVEGMRHASNRN